jgi:hypothetical protein
VLYVLSIFLSAADQKQEKKYYRRAGSRYGKPRAHSSRLRLHLHARTAPALMTSQAAGCVPFSVHFLWLYENAPPFHYHPLGRKQKKRASPV